MLRWTIESITLNLKYTWKISRNATDQKTNLIVTVTDGVHTGKGECAPNIRYNESAEKGLIEFDGFINNIPEITEVHQLLSVLKSKHISNSLSFAIESAWIHFKEKKDRVSFYSITGLTPVPYVPISYTIPIMETGKLKNFVSENNLDRFKFIKLKVNHENALESVTHLLSFCSSRIMVDANESFTDVEQCIYWLEKIKKYPLVLVEQPMPSMMIEESAYLKRYCTFPLFADEAMTDHADFSELKKSFDGVNMKLMKAGSYLNGIRLLKEAKENNMQTMIGCMVETSLAISSAMRLCSLTDYADLDSFLLVSNEPFHLIDEVDGVLSIKY